MYHHFKTFSSSISVLFNNITVHSQLSIGNGKGTVEFELPSGSGVNVISIKSDYFEWNHLFDFDRPVLNDISPALIDLSDAIIIKGDNFGDDASLISIFINDVLECTNINLIRDHSEISCRNWTIINDELHFDSDPLLIVDVDGLNSSTSVEFAPSVFGYQLDGDEISIRGFGFNLLSSFKVLFDDIEIMELSSSKSKIKFDVPSFSENVRF
ncbi:hypothetical protein GEMRC1_008495 [Eukaryota sp. GEM-RC1]